ncbi:MAG TPA: hypothetical protein VEQ58_01955 [Polyangiaceae bacterium]|nr:hypothetical protein [Polyangiaceae bacterium]
MLLLAALPALGCAKFQTARECGSFVEAISQWRGQGASAAPSSSAAPSAAPRAAPPPDSRALAERYDDLAKRIDALKLTSPELVPRAVRYQKLAREAAGALRDVAAAVEKGDAEKARRRRVEFDDIARGEAPLVADINAVCR